MTVSAPEVTTVAVAEEPAASGDFTQAVPLDAGESFSFVDDDLRAHQHLPRAVPAG